MKEEGTSPLREKLKYRTQQDKEADQWLLQFLKKKED
jgi:hypothetical protein